MSTSHNGIVWNAAIVDETLSDVRRCTSAVRAHLAELLGAYYNRPFRDEYLGPWAWDWLEYFIHHVAVALRTVRSGVAPDRIACIRVAADSNEYMRRAIDDLTFHSQLTAVVASFVSGEHLDRVRLIRESVVIRSGRPESVGTRIMRGLSANADGTLIVAPYLKCSRREVLHSAWEWRHWVRWDELCYPIRVTAVVDDVWRRDRVGIGGENLAAVATALMPLYLPVIFLEGYQNFREQALGIGLRRPRTLYSANALYGHSLFKLLAAEWRLEGTKLLYHQHGGNYGLDDYHALENYESSVADRYFTWGWGGISGRSAPLPPALPHFRRRQPKWLLVSCIDYPRTPFRLHFQPMPGTIQTMQRDLAAFLGGVRQSKDLLVRPYLHDYGWGMQSLIQQAAPRARMDDGRTGQFELYGQSRLVVHPYLSTGWLETLALNVPTVCIYDPEAYRFRMEARQLIGALEGIGILHRSGISAARFVTDLGSDPHGWWMKPEVQDVRNRFIQNYANFSSYWKSKWESEFRQAIDQDSRIIS